MLGFGAFFLVILCECRLVVMPTMTYQMLLSGAAASILLTSDKTSLEEWKVGRNKLLPLICVSIFKTLINLLILLTLGDRAIIKF